MKINFILPFTNLTGGIRVIFLYCNYLIESGHDVVCYVPMKAYKFNHSIFEQIKATVGNSLKRRDKVDWFNCAFKIKLVPIINNTFIRDADITVATAWPTAFDLEKLKDDKGKKVYLIQDYEVWSGKLEDVNKSYTLPLNRIVITKSLHNLLKDKFNVESEIIYNGLNKDEYLYEDKICNKQKVISMLYNKAENKGSREGIEVLLNVINKYDVKIKLFGVKKGNDIPSNFEFYENPSREQLMRIYSESDIYVFPSKNEAWGLPVMEAMANKCAIVGTNVGCLEEIGIDNENSMIVNNLDYDSMLSKIEFLIENEKELRRIQNNGYHLAEKFKWDNSFKDFEEYLKKLLSVKEFRSRCEETKKIIK